jgi:predicted metal-binding membrane protein
MLLMAAVGHNRLDGMILLSGIMAAERLTPWGTRLARAMGVALIAAGLIWLFTAASTGHSHQH